MLTICLQLNEEFFDIKDDARNYQNNLLILSFGCHVNVIIKTICFLLSVMMSMSALLLVVNRYQYAKSNVLPAILFGVPHFNSTIIENFCRNCMRLPNMELIFSDQALSCSLLASIQAQCPTAPTYAEHQDNIPSYFKPDQGLKVF